MNRSIPDSDPRLAAWLEEGPTSGPGEVLSSTLARVRTTRQDRRWHTMSVPLKLAATGAVALALGIALVPKDPTQQAGTQVPSASPSSPAAASPAPLRQGSLGAGDYTATPFAGDALAPCGADESPCLEAARDDHIRVTITVPDGWAGAPLGAAIWLAAHQNSGPAGAGFLIGRGGWLYSDPCAETGDADIAVGPTVADFVEALVAHPLLDLTEPVDVTVGGHPGTYLELAGPADRTDCPYFQAWAPTFYAQGDSNRQLIWVVDVDGVRVVIHGSEFPGTAPERSAELRAIVESMRIDAEPVAEPSTAPVVHGFVGARGGPAGLYSWTPGTWGWMHRSDGGGWIAMTFRTLAGDEPLMAEVAPSLSELDRPLGDRPTLVADSRSRTWVLDAAGDTVYVTVTSEPDTTQTSIEHAEAVIESIRVEETETGPGYRLVFELDEGWDSG